LIAVDIRTLLEYYAAHSGDYGRFGTTYRSHFKCQEIQEPLKMGPIRLPEISVLFYFIFKYAL